VSGAARAPFDVDAFLRAAREHAERALAELPLADVPRALHQPIEYAVRAGGKRLRPVLCATAWSAVAGAEAPAAVWRAAAAVELIHAYSLVHDDLPFMDDDDVRRGRPTTHRAHGTATGTVAGAAMIAVAFRLLDDVLRALDATREQRHASVETLAEAAGAAGMVGGQWLDLAAEGRALQRAELERVHRLKTGALIRAPVVLGGILAGASAKQRSALATFGASVGLAFQIADDLLDASGDESKAGKALRKDAGAGKATFVSLMGEDKARDQAQALAEQAIGHLAQHGKEADVLRALARFVVERDR
jgi:farnesyl diphosphate synthase